MTWSLNANGSLGDPGVVEKFFGEIKALLSKPEFGVMGSMFTGLGKWETNFHTVAQDLADITAPQDPSLAPHATDGPAAAPEDAGVTPGADAARGETGEAVTSAPK